MTATHTIVRVIAAEEGVEPTDLPPLYGAVDPTALERVLASLTDEEAQIRFRYAGYAVTITGAGDISID